MAAEADPDYVPSGFMHPSKRIVGGLSSSKKSADEAGILMGRVFRERSSKAIAETIPARGAKPSTSRNRLEKKGPRQKFVSPLGPTPERLAKGDMVVSGGTHRSSPPIDKLARAMELDEDAKTNLGMFNAAEKLKRHYDGSVNGVRSLDSLDIDAMLSRGHSDLTGEEGWVHHHDEFKKACKMMGFYPDRPNNGCARIVISIVCKELGVTETGEIYFPGLRKERMLERTKERLRIGLMSLAYHWHFL